MSEQATQEITTDDLTPEIIEAAKKLKEKRDKAKEKAIENVRENYPFANPDTVTYDSQAGKFKVEVTCIVTGEKHWRYTSDLKQTKGVSPAAKKEADKVAKKEKKALLKRAMQAIENGDLDLDNIEEDSAE